MPQARATGTIQSGTITGKLNGVIPAQTPTGWRTVSQSTSRARFGRLWPIKRLGMPQANSTISIPRWTEARDSARVLPCSRVTSWATSSAWAVNRSQNRNKTRARSTAGVSAQVGSAAAAARTARSTSPAVPSGTRAITRPVEGLYTSPNRCQVRFSRSSLMAPHGLRCS